MEFRNCYPIHATLENLSRSPNPKIPPFRQLHFFCSAETACPRCQRLMKPPVEKYMSYPNDYDKVLAFTKV
jgi:hypothetical protein